MRFSVDGWDPGYGTAVEMDGLPESQAQVDTTIEVSAANWAPIPPKAGDTAVLTPPRARRRRPLDPEPRLGFSRAHDVTQVPHRGTSP
jgi:hypothetical protein